MKSIYYFGNKVDNEKNKKKVDNEKISKWNLELSRIVLDISSEQEKINQNKNWESRISRIVPNIGSI